MANSYDPNLEKNPPRHLLGWWEHDTDSPDKTLAKEKSVFAGMEDKHPERFAATPPKAVVNQVVLDKVKAWLKADGMEDGSMDLTYFERFATEDGGFLQWLAQRIGSCVASGAMRVLTIRQIIDIVLFGDFEETMGSKLVGTDNVAPFAPYHYGCGRRIGGMRGGDGSYCSVQIQALMTEGWLPCDSAGLQSDAFPEPQNSSTYRSWGNWNHLDEFAKFAQPFDLLESENIGTAERSMSAIADEFKPQMICSGWGFAPAYQHKDGFWVYRRSGSWSHNMSLVANRVASDRNVFPKVKNSWGMHAHKDGDHFYIEMDTLDQWLRNAECRTLGNLQQRSAELPIAF